MGRVLFLALLLAGVIAASAGAATTTFDANGTALLNGAKVFPIVLAKGPPLGGTTPTGADALNEAISAGVDFFKVGPATTAWTGADITDANNWDQAVASRGAYTWLNLSTLSQAAPGSSTDSLLQQVVTTLLGDSTGSAGIGMWKGADEPWWSNIAPAALQFAYCRSTSRGDPSWCGGEPSLDQAHLWVTIEAPRGTASDLAPYSSVTDAHGIDDYPVTLAAGASPDLHQVGVWTSTISAATPSHSIWTTLQVCASGSYDANGNYVLPTRFQERYMIYDAIINGARNLAFYGGNNVNCMNATDRTHGWNWTFWNDVLKGLVQEINAGSPLAPVLVNPASTQTPSSSDPTTEVISRQGSANDLWVIAARSGSGSQAVTIAGLPTGTTSGSVYTENRSVPVTNGSLTDSFGQWDVHVYHLTTSTTGTSAPTISSFTPSSGPISSSVTISGTNLAGATSVTFNGVAAAAYTATDTQITATVPSGATSGPIGVTTAGGSAASTASFTVTVPDFSLTAFPGTQTVVRGGNTNYTITVTPSGGFNSNVELTVSGTPAGATTSFTPSSTGSTSTLNVQTTNSTKAGNYTITITGTSGTLKHTATVTLQVRRK